jgi:peptidoglycan/xylan/chitin deacetylase (PgdA/CDA1 family)
MAVQGLVHSLDAMLAKLSLRAGTEQNSLLSFLFHGLFASTEESLSGVVDPQQGITIDMFRALVRHFKSQCYRFVSPTEIAQGLGVKGRYILLTFDDGYYNNVRALPVLEEFDVPAVFFISSGHVKEQKAFWWDVVYRQHRQKGDTPVEMRRAITVYKRLRTLEVESRLKEAVGADALFPVGNLDRPFSPDELREFAKHKYVFLGNHTRDHAILTNYSTTEARDQMHGAQRDIAEMSGQIPTMIAYPNGNVSPGIHKIAREIGLTLGIGVRAGKNRLPVKIASAQAMSLKRYTLWGDREIEQQCRVSRSALSLYRLLQGMKSSTYSG